MKKYLLIFILSVYWFGSSKAFSAKTRINPKVCEAHVASSQIYDELIKRYPPNEYFIIYSGRHSTLHWMTAWVKNPGGNNVDYYFHPYTGFHSTKKPMRLKYLNAVLKFQSENTRKVVLFRELQGGGVVSAMNLDLLEIQNSNTSNAISIACLATFLSQKNSMRSYALYMTKKEWNDPEAQSFLPKEIVLIRHDRFFEIDVFRRASYRLPYIHPFSYLRLDPEDRTLTYEWLVEKNSEEEIVDLLFQRNFAVHLEDLNLEQSFLENFLGTDTNWKMEFDSTEQQCSESFGQRY